MTADQERIVVGVDGSVPSREALREARSSGASVEAVLVWSDPWAISGPPTLRTAGKEGLGRLEDLLSDCVRHAVHEERAAGVPMSMKVVAGHPAEALVAESGDAKMLVVGTTGLSGLKRWMLGSVSQHCAQLSRVPVVIVPPPDR